MFGGITEYILKSAGNNRTDSDTQKAPFGSGLSVATILEDQASTTEKKLFHDFLYSALETKCFEENIVVDIDTESVTNYFANDEPKSFIRVKGRIIFNDFKITQDTLRNFNDLGYALGVVTSGGNISEEQINDAKENVSDRNARARIDANAKTVERNFRKKLLEKGLQINEDFLKNSVYVLQHGYQDQFEVQIPFETDTGVKMFSAILDRSQLLEDEYTLIKKFGRFTEREFTLFGTVAQKMRKDEKEPLFDFYLSPDREKEGMREVIMGIVNTIAGVENSFTGKLDHEVVIDPIALYIKL
jgi:hypothetical protein